jgi:hypothetical protein
MPTSESDSLAWMLLKLVLPAAVLPPTGYANELAEEMSDAISRPATLLGGSFVMSKSFPNETLRKEECSMSVMKRQLGEIADIYVGLPTLQSDIRGAGRSGNVLTVRALTGSEINPDELVHADLEKLNSQGRDLDKYRASAGDILVSARSTSLKTAILSKELDGIIINATLIGIRCNPLLEPRLLLAYLNHSEGQAALEAVAQSATMQMNITANALRSLLIPIPTVEIQRQLVQILIADEEAYHLSLQVADSRHQLTNQIIFNYLKEGRYP